MATQNFYGDVAFKKAVTVTGKVTAAAGTASGELATKGQVDASYASAIVRGVHTGTQPSSTISDFATAVDGRIDTKITALVGGAPGTFDTLKEISDWIATDVSGTTALTTRVSTAESDIDALESAVEALEVGAGGGTYKANIGDASASSFTLTHNLNTFDVAVEVFENTGQRQTVFPVVTRPSVNTVFVDFDGVVVASGSHRVIVRGS